MKKGIVLVNPPLGSALLIMGRIAWRLDESGIPNIWSAAGGSEISNSIQIFQAEGRKEVVVVFADILDGVSGRLVQSAAKDLGGVSLRAIRDQEDAELTVEELLREFADEEK